MKGLAIIINIMAKYELRKTGCAGIIALFFGRTCYQSNKLQNFNFQAANFDAPLNHLRKKQKYLLWSLFPQ